MLYSAYFNVSKCGVTIGKIKNLKTQLWINFLFPKTPALVKAFWHFAPFRKPMVRLGNGNIF